MLDVSDFAFLSVDPSRSSTAAPQNTVSFLLLLTTQLFALPGKLLT